MGPWIWKRYNVYVDDTFCEIEEEHVNSLLDHLNKQRHTIKFTMKKEENRSLPFLDKLLKRREDGRLDISVYRKPTHTNR